MSIPMDAGQAFLAQAQSQILSAQGLDSRAGAHLMSLGPAAVHIDSALSNFLVSYANRECVADKLMPIVTVSKRSDKIFEFPVDTYQTIANTQIAGNRGQVTEIAYSLNTRNYSVSDYGLRDFVSTDEEANADAPLQPRLMSAELCMNFLALSREIRVQTQVFNTANFASGNQKTLSGSARWDTSTGTPVQDLFDAIATPLVRPNVLVMGEQVWTKFRNSPDVTRFITGRAATTNGAVPFFVDEKMVAQAFGLDEVVIGRAKYNSAREGATVTSSYIWGKTAALLRVEASPNQRKTSCWGYTFRFGPIGNQVIYDAMSGVRGGNWVKITHSDDERPLASANAGYLFITPVS